MLFFIFYNELIFVVLNVILSYWLSFAVNAVEILINVAKQ